MAETEQGHRIRVGLFDQKVEEAFGQALKKILPLLRSIDHPAGKPFRWSDYPLLAKTIDKATAGLKTDLKTLFKKAIEQEYSRGLNNKITAQDKAYGATIMRTLNAQQAVLREQRQTAVNAYIRRVESGGFKLSQRVWQIGDQARADMATAIKAGLEDGLDYRQLARSVREFLVDPNRLYRRVRGKDGMLHLSNAAKNYHPGQGIYRSSVRNAQRVARTETNMAYRRGEYDSLQGDPFILGIRVNLSANHTTTLPNGKVVHFTDICDKLSNQSYPKDFKFTGWHPHCRCYITYIMVPYDEALEMIRNGLTSPPRSKPITDVPQAFKDWISENRERLEKSKSLPYFVRDNQKYISGVKYTPEGLAQIEAAEGAAVRHEPTLLEKAEIRHAARTPEQIAQIRKEWHDRQMWRKHAQGMLRATEGIKDPNYENARKSIAEDLQHARYKSATMGASMLRQAIKYKLADLAVLDAKLADLKDHTSAELEAVKDAVEKKFGYFSKYNLEDQKKKLEFEVDWVEKNKKYSTWKIAQRAYKKALAAVEQKIVLEEVDNKLADIKAYVADHPKSKKVADLLAAAEAGKASGESMAYIKAKLKQAENVIKINEQTKAYLAAKRGGGASSTLEAFKKTERARLEEELKDLKAKMKNPASLSALERINYKTRIKELEENMDYEVLKPYFKQFQKETPDTADAALRPLTEKAWASLTLAEKKVVSKYTQTYNYLNEPLRGLVYRGSTTGYASDMPTLTKALDKCLSIKDMVVRRGTDDFGIPSLGHGRYLSNLKTGDVWVDKGFLSTAAGGPNSGFYRSYNLVIVVPKGSAGIYAEPFSHFTDNMKYSYTGTLWDGHKVESMNNEIEWIGQRGSLFKVLKVDGYTIYMEMLGQKK